MALPTAQLGQMPTMQMPYNIPVQTYTKEPKAWEKALLSVLAGTANAVMSHGVENMMQPDYAPAGGQASGFSKFWSGPTINQARASELDRMDMDKAKMDEAARQDRLNRMVTMTGQNRVQSRALGEQALQTEQAANTLEHQRAMQEMEAQGLTQTGAHQQVQDLLAQINAERQGQLAGAQTSHLGAETKELQSRAKREAVQDWIMRHSRAPTPADLGPNGELLESPTKPSVNPNIAKFAGGASSPQMVAPAQPSSDEAIRAMLSAGKSPDDIVSQMSIGQQRQNATQQRANIYEVSDEARAARQQAAIEEIKRRLGLQGPDLTDMARVPW